jgi:hypothetical protein
VSIGAVTLFMTRRQIERTYGRPVRTERIKDYFPVGTKYQGKLLERSDYRVRQGVLRISYVDDRARVLETTSPRYRTPDGIHVGLHVRGKSCRGIYRGVCVRGFYYDDCTGLLIRSVANGTIGIGLELAGSEYHPDQLRTRGDSVSRILFGDENVLLTCF